MVYIDTPFRVPMDHPTAPRCFKGKLASHLMADTTEELVAYAKSIGLNPSWIQHAGRPTEHFDLTGSRLERAQMDPRVMWLRPKEMARMWMARRGK